MLLEASNVSFAVFVVSAVTGSNPYTVTFQNPQGLSVSIGNGVLVYFFAPSLLYNQFPTTTFSNYSNTSIPYYTPVNYNFYTMNTYNFYNPQLITFYSYLKNALPVPNGVTTDTLVSNTSTSTLTNKTITNSSVADGSLSSNVVLANNNQTITGAKTFSNSVNFTTTSISTFGYLSILPCAYFTGFYNGGLTTYSSSNINVVRQTAVGTFSVSVGGTRPNSYIGLCIANSSAYSTIVTTTNPPTSFSITCYGGGTNPQLNDPTQYLGIIIY